jgi:hypothetical protein
MKNVHDKKYGLARQYGVIALTALCIFALAAAAAADGLRAAKAVPVIVHPKFGGQIIGYTVDPNGTLGLLSESVAEGINGDNLAATEIFDQNTGAIVAVVGKVNHTRNDYVTQPIDAADLGLVLFQKNGENDFLTLNPLSEKKFTGTWTPTPVGGYGISNISVAQGAEVAVFENDLNAGNSYVFGSNVAENTFGTPVSLASIIDGDEFLVSPQIAFDSATNQAVLADSDGCPEPERNCATNIALVNLTTGAITEFNDDLGVGQLNGLAVDPAKGIAVTTTLVDQGVEFYNLKTQTGHEAIIPNHGSEIQAGEDVEFDAVHKVFLVAQYTSTGNINDLEPRVYVYRESGNVLETVVLQGDIGIGGRMALNPKTRTGFVPMIEEPQGVFAELQSFTY